jgi:hypothetical protein
MMNARANRNRGTTSKGNNFRRKKSGNRWRWLNAGIVIALVGVLGAVLAAVLPHYLGPGSPSAPDLEVDSITLQSYAQQHPSLISDAGSEPGYETLDFKLRNTGGQLAFISGVRITVNSLAVLHASVFGTFVPVSATYGFILPTRKGIFTAQVSEEAAPGQADRFDLSISLPKNTPEALYAFDISLALVYDKSNAVSAGKISLDLSPGYTAGTKVEIGSSPPPGGS